MGRRRHPAILAGGQATGADLVLEVASTDDLLPLSTAGPAEGVARLLTAGGEPGHEALLCVLPGQGTAVATVPLRGTTGRTVLEAYVARGARGRGLGRALVQAVVAAALGRDGEVVSVSCPTGSAADAVSVRSGDLRPVQLEHESVWTATAASLTVARRSMDEESATSGWTVAPGPGRARRTWSRGLPH